MQEKLAEAILKESQDSSEPELSDTSTEDEEDVRKRPEQDKKGTEGECFPQFLQHCRLKCAICVCRGTCDRYRTENRT